MPKVVSLQSRIVSQIENKLSALRKGFHCALKFKGVFLKLDHSCGVYRLFIQGTSLL